MGLLAATPEVGQPLLTLTDGGQSSGLWAAITAVALVLTTAVMLLKRRK